MTASVCLSLSFLICMHMGLGDRVQHCCEHCACMNVSPVWKGDTSCKVTWKEPRSIVELSVTSTPSSAGRKIAYSVKPHVYHGYVHELSTATGIVLPMGESQIYSHRRRVFLLLDV